MRFTNLTDPRPDRGGEAIPLWRWVSVAPGESADAPGFLRNTPRIRELVMSGKLDMDGPPYEEEATIDVNQLTKKGLRGLLDSAGVEYPAKATKAALLKLAKEL